MREPERCVHRQYGEGIAGLPAGRTIGAKFLDADIRRAWKARRAVAGRRRQRSARLETPAESAWAACITLANRSSAAAPRQRLRMFPGDVRAALRAAQAAAADQHGQRDTRQTYLEQARSVALQSGPGRRCNISWRRRATRWPAYLVRRIRGRHCQICRRHAAQQNPHQFASNWRMLGCRQLIRQCPAILRSAAVCQRGRREVIVDRFRGLQQGRVRSPDIGGNQGRNF